MNTQSEITAYLLATYDLAEINAFLQLRAKDRVFDNPITICLAESEVFDEALRAAYAIKKAQFQAFNADFSKKLNQFLENKPVTKNSVVCTIASKLSKAGIKKPMSIAWQVYNLTLDCLNGLANRYSFTFLLPWYCLVDVCNRYGVTVNDILPKHTAKLLTSQSVR